MINATTNSSNNSQKGGSPMPTPPVADTKPPESTATPTPAVSTTPTPETPTKTAEAMMPPKVLPSHAAPHTHAVKPGVAPHQDIASLHKSLSDKINDSKPSEPAKAAQSDSVPPPPSVPASSSTPTQPTIDTLVTAPPPKGGIGLKALIAVLVFLITVVGAGAAYYLQTQSQDTRQQAFLPDWGEDANGQTRLLCENEIQKDHGLEITVKENPICPRINQGQTNNINAYSATYTLRNTSDYNLEVSYTAWSNHCPELPYGTTDTPIPGCHTETGRETKTIRLAWASNSAGTPDSRTQTITVNGGGQACGSWQTDMHVTQIKVFEKNSGNLVKTINETEGGCLNTGDVEGWTLCQTGGSCAQPATKISGSVVCYDNGQSYAVTNATVNVKDKNFTTDGNGIYTSDSYEKDTFIASRLTLPQQLNLKNTKTGETMTVPSSGVKINAFNGCDANFMNGNCGGITTERQTQCSNAPKDSSGKPMPNSYEWCKLAGGTENRTGFDFALSGCVAPPPSVPPTTPPTPKACNELCSPIDPNSCAPGANGTIKCVSTPQGEHRCRDTRFASQANCQAPVTPPPTTPPTGGMCVNLCGVGSASSATPDMSVCTSIGGVHNQPKLNEYLHLKCNVSGTPGQVNIMLTKPNGAETKINTNNNPTASYKIDVAGTYSARCEVIGTGGGGSTPTPVPTPTPTPRGTTNPTLSCASIGGTCKSRCSGTETPQNVLGCAGEGGQSMVCCASVASEVR